jgi:hypothetical protein
VESGIFSSSSSGQLIPAAIAELHHPVVRILPGDMMPRLRHRPLVAALGAAANQDTVATTTPPAEYATRVSHRWTVSLPEPATA